MGYQLNKPSSGELFKVLKEEYKTKSYQDLEQEVKQNLDYMRNYKNVTGRYGNKFHYLKSNFKYLKNQWLTSSKNFIHPLILIKAALYLYYNEKGE